MIDFSGGLRVWIHQRLNLDQVTIGEILHEYYGASYGFLQD